LSVLAFACVLSLGAVQVAMAQSDAGASADSPNANPVINVGHFAPFAATADGTSVTVRVSGTDAITDFVYPAVAKGIDILPAGTYTVEILPTGTATVAISGVVTLENDKKYTLLAVGDGANQPLALKALDDNPAAPAPGTARVRIAHYAPFANTLAATRVDICLDATDTAVPGLTNVEFGQESGWLPLPAGIYDLFIAPAGTNCSTPALDLPALAILAGKTYDVYAVGGANGWPLEVKSITGLDFPAHVTVGHFAPFSTTVPGTAVDIKVNGALAFTSVVFGNFVPQVQLPPGPALVEILPAGTSTVALSGTLDLKGDAAYNLFAIGGANGWPLTFSATEISKTAPLDKALITIGHLAPFAPTGDATAVDICTDANAVVLGGVEYPNVAANLPLDPGVYDLKIALAGTGCAAVALDLPPVVLSAGEIYDIFAIGTLTGAFPLETTTTTGLELAALVTVGHFAPFASDVGGTAVDIRVNGSLAFTNVVFGDFVPKVALPPGPTLVEILPTGTVTVALSGTFTLTAGTNYDLFAIGGTNNQDLAFSATVISDTAPAGKALVTIGHLAPFALNADATAVDICTDAGEPVPGLTNLKYPQVLANLPLDPGPYDLKITIAGSDCESGAIDLPRFRLFAGDIADVFAIGTLTDEFPLEVVTTTGLYTVERYLPIIRVFAQGF
jgi:hypothetical protein